ncbi:unnamed protein product [Caenorhabditis nigoni]
MPIAHVDQGFLKIESTCFYNIYIAGSIIMSTWYWIFFAAVILVANGSENQENDMCGKEVKSSTPSTTIPTTPSITTMEATTTGCACPSPFALNFTNDNYSLQWWNNITDEVKQGYDQNHVVAGRPFRPAFQQLDCSVLLTCSIQIAPGFKKEAVGLYIVTTENKVHNITRIAGKDEMLRLE